MSELKEVFDMVTKQTEPDLDSWNDQERRQRRTVRNRKAGAIAVVAAVVAVAAILSITLPGEDRTTDIGTNPLEEGPSRLFFLDLQTGEMSPLPGSLIDVDACWYEPSPDGSQIAQGTCRGGALGSAANVMRIASIDGTNERTLRLPGGLTVVSMAWSPDGSTIAYQARQGGTKDIGNLFAYDLSTDRSSQLTDFELTDAWRYTLHMDVSPDGRHVIFDLPRSTSQFTKWDVWSIPISGGEPTLEVRNAAFPSYLSDGEEIAFVVPTSTDLNGYEIAIASSDGAPGTVARITWGTWWPRVSPDRSRIAYRDGGSIYVIDVSTGDRSKVAYGVWAKWLDDDTLIVTR